MKHVMLGLLLLASAGCISTAAAEDLSGQWFFQLERNATMGNHGSPVECIVRQHRLELTLRCGGSRDEMRGELRGRKVVLRHEQTNIPPVSFANGPYVF